MCIDCKKKLYTLSNFNFMSKKNFALFMNVMSMANATPHPPPISLLIIICMVISKDLDTKISQSKSVDNC